MFGLPFVLLPILDHHSEPTCGPLRPSANPTIGAECFQLLSFHTSRIWVVVKIMAPFWVCRITRRTQKGTIFFTTTTTTTTTTQKLVIQPQSHVIVQDPCVQVFCWAPNSSQNHLGSRLRNPRETQCRLSPRRRRCHVPKLGPNS